MLARVQARVYRVLALARAGFGNESRLKIAAAALIYAR